MTCKKAREIMILAHYGEAGADETARLEEHVRACPACAVEREETRRLFALVDAHAPEEAAAPDWERVWTRVRSGIAASGPARRPAPWRRWAFAGAALTAVLVAGIAIGRVALAPGPGRAALAGATAAGKGAAPNGIRPAFAAHLDDLKPLLLDYAHFVPGQSMDGRVAVDENALRALMLQNVLLKRKLAEKDPAAADLLDDLDLVLKEILNRDSRNAKSPAEIRDLIERRDILFKMEILKKT